MGRLVVLGFEGGKNDKEKMNALVFPLGMESYIFDRRRDVQM